MALSDTLAYLATASLISGLDTHFLGTVLAAERGQEVLDGINPTNNPADIMYPEDSQGGMPDYPWFQHVVGRADNGVCCYDTVENGATAFGSLLASPPPALGLNVASLRASTETERLIMFAESNYDAGHYGASQENPAGSLAEIYNSEVYAPLWETQGAGQGGSGSKGTAYTVVTGDTLSSIAERFGISLGQIEAANPEIYDPNLIYPGEVVTVPSETGESGVFYVVLPGDSLTTIAAKYGETWQNIYALNREVIGPNPNLIFPGTKLRVK